MVRRSNISVVRDQLMIGTSRNDEVHNAHPVGRAEVPKSEVQATPRGWITGKGCIFSSVGLNVLMVAQTNSHNNRHGLCDGVKTSPALAVSYLALLREMAI